MKYFRFFSYSVVASAIVILVSGCLFGFGQKSYVDVKYFDLDTPPRMKLQNVQLRILPLQSTEPVKFKMVYCGTDCEMIVDDYNKWVQPPCLLLTRYLQGAFEQKSIDAENAELSFSGNIFRFRIDLRDNTASLGVNYVIRTSPNGVIRGVYRKSSVFNCKFKKQGPKYFAAAMSDCARQLAVAIEKDVKALLKYKNGERKKLEAKAGKQEAK
jgi:hypothetical protein